MSTRANIIVVDDLLGLSKPFLYYRHSDGYPRGTMPTLTKFMSWVKEGKIRDNAQQASGWLIVIGHTEYAEYCRVKPSGPTNWMVGAYEPTDEIHADIEYLYLLDLTSKTIKIMHGGASLEVHEALEKFKAIKPELP